MVLVVMVEKREIEDNGRERCENSYKNILHVAMLLHGDRVFHSGVSLIVLL